MWTFCEEDEAGFHLEDDETFQVVDLNDEYEL